MKKALPLIVVAVLVAAAAWFFLKKAGTRDGQPGRAAELAPADTIVLIDFPDVPRSKARWKETAIRKIADEPEWREFTAKWDDFAAQNAEWREVNGVFDQLQRADPEGFFLAFNSFDGPFPKAVGGFSYRGKKSDVQAVVSSFRKRILDAYPAAKAGDLTNYEGTEIETLKDKDMTLSMAYRDNWFFFSTDNELLLKTLSRYIKKADAPASLAGDPLWKDTIKHGKPEPDMSVFVRWGVVTKMLEDEVGKGPGPVFPSNPTQIEALLYSARMDGLLMRDHLYMKGEKLAKAEAFANRSAAFTAPATYFYAGGHLGPYSEVFKEVITAIDKQEVGMSKALATKGLKSTDLIQIFGPEIAVRSDWDDGALAIPTLFAAVEIRDREKARLVAELLVAQMEEGKTSKSEEDGTTIWTAGGMIPALQPTIALNDRHLMFALNLDTVKGALKRAKSGPGDVLARADFQSAVKTIAAPDVSVLYVDMKTLFERLYEKLKPMAAFGLMGQPDAAKFFDPAKLPKAETISRHLAPMMVSYSLAEGGTQMDCSGSVSLVQSYIPLVGAALFSVKRVAPMATPPVTPAPATPPAK
ncbi:MAG: hypothetical protein ABMA01_07595 [Chthoniobacteraceae bacterium]